MKTEKSVQELQSEIEGLNIYKYFSDIVIVCIGTNKIIGDCIGPMAGEKLIQVLGKRKNVQVYGDMNKTVNFKNAKYIFEQILIKYKNPFVITIDSALGKEEMINQIIVSNGIINIGNSLGCGISYYSNINIKGVVGKYEDVPEKNMRTLMNVDCKLVQEISNKIALGVFKIINSV